MVSSSSAASPDSQRGDAPPPAVAGRGSPVLRVFLVEDSPLVREGLSDLLAEPGRLEIVGFATTEADAVRQLLAQPVDVAIVDLKLEEGSGIGVIESVRAVHATAPPTIIVLTNYAFPEFESTCRDRGADYFFDKAQFGAVRALLRSFPRGAPSDAPDRCASARTCRRWCRLPAIFWPTSKSEGHGQPRRASVVMLQTSATTARRSWHPL